MCFHLTERVLDSMGKEYSRYDTFPGMIKLELPERFTRSDIGLALSVSDSFVYH